MMNATDFGTSLGVVLRIVALIVMVVGVLPRSYKESKVPNGLGFLRRLIFFFMCTFTLMNVFVALINIGRVTNLLSDDVTGIMATINGIGEVFLSIALYLIYHRDYGRIK